jgi:UDP-N-acetyl-D-mannosaminuronate dehydrogenase
MPQHVADRVSDWVRKEQGKADWKVLLLGYSYKSNVGDVRFTPSKQVLTELVKRDIKVSIYDPHAEPIVSDAEKKLFVDDPYEEARKIHCIVALIDHDIFKSLNFSVLAKKMLKPLFYDCTFSFNAEELRQSGFSYRGVGRL